MRLYIDSIKSTILTIKIVDRENVRITFLISFPLLGMNGNNRGACRISFLGNAIKVVKSDHGEEEASRC